MKNMAFYTFPIGKIGIAADDGGICGVFFSTEAPPEDVYKRQF